MHDSLHFIAHPLSSITFHNYVRVHWYNIFLHLITCMSRRHASDCITLEQYVCLMLHTVVRSKWCDRNLFHFMYSITAATVVMLCVGHVEATRRPSPSMPRPSSSVCAGRASNSCGEEWKTWNCSRVHSLLCGFQVFTFCFEITEGVFIIFLYIICVRHTCTCLHEEPFSYIYSCLLAIQEHLYPFFQVIHLFSGNFCLQ